MYQLSQTIVPNFEALFWNSKTLNPILDGGGGKFAPPQPVF